MNDITDFVRKHLRPQERFVPGKTKVHYSGPVIDEKELSAVMESLFAGWLAEGKFTAEFEKRFAIYIGKKECVLVNSGSSALLLAFRALMHSSLKDPLKVGDEVITAALTFPTTLNSILLNSLVPVFVDVNMKTFNIDSDMIEGMLTRKTRAILITHHLGYPCDMDRIMSIAKKHKLYVIEDCCDAHGSEYQGKKLGSFGDLSCFSFYCAHAMTMGEGGAVLTDDVQLRSIITSLKTCGRACVCPVCVISLDPDAKCSLRWKSGVDDYQGFDKRTLFTDIGYKMKILDLQAAMGLEQLKKLPGFVQQRLDNAAFIIDHLSNYSKYLQLPEVEKHVKPSWFALPIIVRAPFKRDDLVKFLESRNIETRPLLGGNLIKQPAYKGINFRSTSMDNTDYIGDNGFYIGCYPGLTRQMLEYMVKSFEDFFRKI